MVAGYINVHIASVSQRVETWDMMTADLKKKKTLPVKRFCQNTCCFQSCEGVEAGRDWAISLSKMCLLKAKSRTRRPTWVATRRGQRGKLVKFLPTAKVSVPKMVKKKKMKWTNDERKVWQKTSTLPCTQCVLWSGHLTSQGFHICIPICGSAENLAASGLVHTPDKSGPNPAYFSC